EYIAEQQPWALAKAGGQDQALDEVLFTAAESVRVIATLLQPIMPAASARLLERLGDGTSPAQLRLDADGAWRNTGTRQLLKGDPLWPRSDSAQERPTDIRATETHVTAPDETT